MPSYSQDEFERKVRRNTIVETILRSLQFICVTIVFVINGFLVIYYSVSDGYVSNTGWTTLGLFSVAVIYVTLEICRRMCFTGKGPNPLWYMASDTYCLATSIYVAVATGDFYPESIGDDWFTNTNIGYDVEAGLVIAIFAAAVCSSVLFFASIGFNIFLLKTMYKVSLSVRHDGAGNPRTHVFHRRMRGEPKDDWPDDSEAQYPGPEVHDTNIEMERQQSIAPTETTAVGSEIQSEYKQGLQSASQSTFLRSQESSTMLRSQDGSSQLPTPGPSEPIEEDPREWNTKFIMPEDFIRNDDSSKYRHAGDARKFRHPGDSSKVRSDV